MSKLDLKAIREWCEKATQGPWEILEPGYVALDDLVDLNKRNYQIYSDSFGSKVHHVGYNLTKENAEFITTARTDIPMLLDAYEALLKQAESMANNLQLIMTFDDSRMMESSARHANIDWQYFKKTMEIKEVKNDYTLLDSQE